MSRKKPTLEDKVDRILKYEETAAFWRRMRFIFWSVFFFVFVLLPLVWTIGLIREVRETELFQNFQRAIRHMQTPAALFQELGQYFEQQEEEQSQEESDIDPQTTVH